MEKLLRNGFPLDFEVIGRVAQSIEKNNPFIIGTYKNVRSIVNSKGIDLIISCVTYAESSILLKEYFHIKTHGCDVVDMPVIYGKLTGKIPIQYVGDEWFVYGPYFSGQTNPLFLNFTRIFDVVLAVITLGLTFPVLLLCMLIMKLTMPGEIYFYQTRVGLNKEPYRIIKLRTMNAGAEKKSGPVWSKGKKDKRITPFGGFLRKSRIDELPQLINILKGEMSFIGPRPERPYFIQKLSEKIPYYDLRFSEKPGLTGWAQVNMKYADDVESSLEKLQYELYYIQESSIFLNIIILFKTIQTVITKPGN